MNSYSKIPAPVLLPSSVSTSKKDDVVTLTMTFAGISQYNDAVTLVEQQRGWSIADRQLGSSLTVSVAGSAVLQVADKVLELHPDRQRSQARILAL